MNNTDNNTPTRKRKGPAPMDPALVRRPMSFSISPSCRVHIRHLSHVTGTPMSRIVEQLILQASSADLA